MVVAHGVDHAEVGEVVLEIDTVRGVVTKMIDISIVSILCKERSCRATPPR